MKLTTENIAKIVAAFLLEKKAVTLRTPNNPFTWAAGWKSPIYCDNRVLLSYPDVRKEIVKFFVQYIKVNYPDVQVIAGVASSGIPWGAIIASELAIPFVYVRAKPKDHGKEAFIEGKLEPGDEVLVIEDLISTGTSSMTVIQHILDAGANVLGLVAIFTYGFPIADEKFQGINYHALSNYEVLIEQAVELKYISASDLESLKEWRKNPSEWGQ